MQMVKLLKSHLVIELGCDVSISSVYNGDLENKIKMLEWGIENGVRIKILEVVKNEREYMGMVVFSIRFNHDRSHHVSNRYDYY